MNEFDKKYDIRFAFCSEIPEVMDFIGKYWRAGHILATNRSFFEYEHVVDGRVNFVIAKNREDEEIHGILGFLPASKDAKKYDGWEVVWKIREDVALPLLGIEIKRRLVKLAGVRTSMGVGDNPKTAVPILKVVFKHTTAKMHHYYCIADKQEYMVAKIREKQLFCAEKTGYCAAKKLNTIAQVKKCYSLQNNKDIIPFKDYWYIEKRYFKHPIYDYQVYGLFEKDAEDAGAILVCRSQEFNDTRVLRIIDYIGKQELFSKLADFFAGKLKEYEYIDMYCLGLEPQYILKAGMVENTDEDANIIPDYFNPFLQSKVDIWVDSSALKCLFFKGDGDQDRPN